MNPETKPNFSFVFENHATDLEDAANIYDTAASYMSEAFVPGEKNICVLENISPDFYPKGVIYPESVVDFEMKMAASSVHRRSAAIYGAANIPNEQQIELGLVEILEKGDDPDMLYRLAVGEAIDQLNKEGYNVGIVYEDGFNFPDDVMQIFAETKPLNLRNFKRMHQEFIRLNRIRDRKLVQKMIEISEESREHVNFFVFRGGFHGGIMEQIPQELSSGVSFGVTINNPKIDIHTPGEIVQKKLIAGVQPSAEEWNASHQAYLTKVKSRRN